jgi:hypothetical protein
MPNLYAVLFLQARKVSKPILVTLILVAGAVLGTKLTDVPAPPTWLTEWTDWVLTMLTIILGSSITVRAIQRLE